MPKVVFLSVATGYVKDSSTNSTPATRLRGLGGEWDMNEGTQDSLTIDPTGLVGHPIRRLSGSER